MNKARSKKIPKTCTDLFDFIKKSPSCYHAIDTVKNTLISNGYTLLCEGQNWNLSEGGKYFVIRNLSSVIAFRIPKSDYNGFMIAASHSDSPTFRIKDASQIKGSDGYVQLCVERYGGMIYSTWLDRPLSAAGRVVVETENGIETRLVNIDRDLLLIPNVAIHMNRNLNDNASYNPAVDLLPLFGSGDKCTSFSQIVAKAAKTDKDKIIGTDMYLYNRQEGTVWGADNEFISAPRLDDLECVFATLEGFLESDDSDSIPMLCVFDNEEVGSATKQGAASTFLSDILTRINEAFGKSASELKRTLSNSFLVSADNAHAVHPNHPEYADKTNRPVMNGGIVIKFSAAQRYTTDAVSNALFRKLCDTADVPVQIYTNRADIPGGSTLGNIVMSQVSVNSVDIGLAQLAMHSSYETAGIRDIDYLIKAMTAFFEKSIVCEDIGNYTIK
ncbi:MAG: M18 family aminopeptidase [Ruminococcaceae bacterium]|nr:M18 family aminopeptidase [Oscillospiraceae bacterium]